VPHLEPASQVLYSTLSSSFLHPLTCPGPGQVLEGETVTWLLWPSAGFAVTPLEWLSKFFGKSRGSSLFCHCHEQPMVCVCVWTSPRSPSLFLQLQDS
jgi:hypothetical protein